MVPAHDVDPAELYRRERDAFVSYLRSVPVEQMATTVPATPAWAVHDVLAHVVGITADLNAERFGAGDSDDWTDAQITVRRHDSVDELAAEWERESPRFETGLGLFGYSFGAHYVGDLLQHVADVHAALGRCPERNDVAIAVGLDFYLESFEETLDEAGVFAVDVFVGDERWRLGTGPVIAELTAPRYELFRALGGRRTLAEIRAMTWAGDPQTVVGLVSRYPPPRATLDEPRPIDL
jgi:uncharacterized protein (TIGR03083 family)